LCYCQEWNR